MSDRDVKIDVAVRLQTALFALDAALDAARLYPPEHVGKLTILDDDLLTNIKHAAVLVRQVFTTLNADLGMYLVDGGSVSVRLPK